jgi:hypothetical protein
MLHARYSRVAVATDAHRRESRRYRVAVMHEAEKTVSLQRTALSRFQAPEQRVRRRSGSAHLKS